MPRRVLDSNVLINHWGFRRQRRQFEDIAEDEAREWARQLIALHTTNAIVTPIYIEYLVGQPTAQAVKLAEAYLGEFDVVDRGKIPGRGLERCDTNRAPSSAAWQSSATGRLLDSGDLQPTAL